MNRLLSAFICVLFFAPPAVSGGSSGLTFLKFESNARTASMGGAGAAMINEAGLLHYNPAGIADMPWSEIQMSHTSWVQGMSLQHGVGVISMGRASLGFLLFNSAIEGIEVRTRPGPSEGEFTARNFAGGAAFAYRLSPSFRVGVTGKYIFEKIFVDDASGYAFDFGIIYHSTTPGLRFGASVLNAGSMSALRNESTDLPLTYRAGTAYDLPFIVQDISVRLAIDALQYSGDDKLHLKIGGEFGYAGFLFVRLGLHSGIEARSMTAGMGIEHGSFRFDYAYLPLLDDFGSGHMVSLGVIFR